MNILTVIHNLMGQATPDEDVLRIVVMEVNKYLSEDDLFDLDDLPDIVSLLAMITLLPDASKYSLYMTNVDVVPKNNVRRRHGRVEKDVNASVLLGTLATIIALLAMTATGEEGVDWGEVIDLIVKVLTMTVG